MIKIDKPDSFILKDKVRVVTEMCVWEMLHSDNSLEIQVKIGRYNKPSKDLVNKICRSELTLDSEELNNFLINLFSNKNFKFNFEQIKNDAYKQKIIESLNNPENKQILLSFFNKKENQHLIPEKIKFDQISAITEFEKSLNENLKNENYWQKWFEQNKWVFGGEAVRIIGDRKIDQNNIADIKIESLDGFLDIVELKTPKEEFWSQDGNHLYPSQSLNKAITQASRYVFETERESNSAKALQTNQITIVKPRCTLIFGRSNNWKEKEKISYRILNSNYHNIQILTFDYVLLRARQILKLNN